MMINRALRGSIAAAGAAVVGVGLVATPALALTKSNSGCTANLANGRPQAVNGGYGDAGSGSCGSGFGHVEVAAFYSTVVPLGTNTNYNWQTPVVVDSFQPGVPVTASVPAPPAHTCWDYKVRTQVFKAGSSTPAVSVTDQITAYCGAK